MAEEKKQERSFELRSEKVRSIVGQIPSSLVRYGISIIGVVLLALFAIAYFLPYKQVYSGTATIYQVPTTANDSTEVNLLLRFENKRPTASNGQILSLQSASNAIAGRMVELSTVRDTMDRQNAVGRFNTKEIQALENQTVDFRLMQSSGNLLQRLLGGSQ